MLRHLPRVIAICGGKRCGKDTIAEHLVRKYEYDHTKIAAKLKHVMSILFNFTEDQIEGHMKEEVDVRYNITPRQAMQFFGTDIMQYEIQKLMPDVGRTFWVKGALQDIKNPHQNIVISDLRFMHEYQEIMATVGECFVIRVERCDAAKNDQHISEIEYMNIPTDVIVKNDKDIQTMLSVIDDIMISKFNPSTSIISQRG